MKEQHTTRILLIVTTAIIFVLAAAIYLIYGMQIVKIEWRK